MRRATLSILLLSFAAPAWAADVLSREHYRVEPGDDIPPLRGSIHRDWEGFYVGGTLGWHAGSDREVDYFSTGLATGFDKASAVTGTGFGLHVGYGWETRRIVYGIEADVDRNFLTGALIAPNIGRTDMSATMAASLRGRIGYSFDHFVVYATAGVAAMQVGYVDISQAGRDTYSETFPGWTIGLGAEWAFSEHWAARLEYRFSSYGTVPLASRTAFPGIVEKHNIGDNAFRAGMTYRFVGY